MDHPSLRNLTSRSFSQPPEKQNEFLSSLGKPHVDSFNYLIDHGLEKTVQSIREVSFTVCKKTVTLKFETSRLLPTLIPPQLKSKNKFIWPSECRQESSTYNGYLIVSLSWSVDGVSQPPIPYNMGRIPIMVKSDLCVLKNLSPAELIKRNEHPDEWGGYFIVKGAEKIVRILLATRRNYPIAVKRNTWKQRGTKFSAMGVFIRSVKEDETSVNNVLHFVTDGTAKLMISCKRSLFYLPVILVMKCLIDVSDEHLYKILLSGYENDFYLQGCIVKMLRILQSTNIITNEDAKNHVGKLFRYLVRDLPPETSDKDISDYIMENCVCVHVDDFKDKFYCLVIMFQKLYCVVQNKCLVEGVDSIMSQELHLAGQLCQQVISDRLQSWLNSLKYLILRESADKLELNLTRGYLEKLMKKCGGVQRTLEYFLSTGNITSTVKTGVQQTKGLVIGAENINRMRYMSHFKAVHRGSYFQEMRTTEVRQLQPDAWGFICPVHTPDGTPCGLLNHLTKSVEVTTAPDKKLMSELPEILVSLGMQPLEVIAGDPIKNCYPVMLDGRLLGYLSNDSAFRFVDKLRMLKIHGIKVPHTLEIVLLPKKEVGQFPGLFLFSGPARMMRPVFNLAAQKIELIGTLEQVYMDICLIPEEAYDGITTHQELSKDNFLSNLACLIPMPDCNQSPRNMYQCQMGKQTMGTPCYTWHLQRETKLYRLQTPASPLFRTLHYDTIELDNYAMGVNAIVAVISYTGYDMEDAMIISKSSFERGFAHGSILKSEVIELPSVNSYFGPDPEKPELLECLGPDGLPFPGAKLNDNSPLCCYFDGINQKFKVEKYFGKTEIIIDNVRLTSDLPTKIQSKETMTKACITYRIPRNPNVGDKFASRAGQKGICSFLWPAEDLPFTETGLVPDIIFNPHGFPSRMTIAMMIECMAGKSAAVHGLVHDASPFKFSEKDTAVEYFGNMLQAGGYNYFGTERLYSGLDGREMTADIFFGVVHYQRLRHMVSDKWQVRSTGPTDIVTRQPVKGRKRGGGVRFGEMERDSLLSHGASFLLHDRLFLCSDKSSALICQICGSTLNPITTVTMESPSKKNKYKKKFSLKCRHCEHGGKIENMEVPHIFKFLSAQLASVNISIKLDTVTSL